MPQRIPGYHDPPLMSSGSIAQPFVSAGVPHASSYGARAEPVRVYYHQPLPTSFYYPPGSFSQPVMSAQQSFPYIPSHPQYLGNVLQSFSSAPMHHAASSHPHPGRFDVSAPGMSQDTSFFEHSSLIKEKRTRELLSKWHISFKGEKRKDPESFIADLTNC